MAVVAIVGRPNVGKSALFNRLSQSRIAIVKDEPGVTRDRIYADVDWQGRRFTLIDTGGLQPGVEQGFAPSIARQVEVAIEEADVILMLVDARAGLSATDEEIAAILRRYNKPVILAANKVDSGDLSSLIFPFYELGFGDPLPVSAEHGLGTGDLLDAIVQHLPPANQSTETEDRIKIAIVGKPNVGKSSIINRLLGDDRVIVSDVPGTTRDAVDVKWDSDYGRFTFIDTAGMRRRTRVDTAVEYYSVVRARRALERADVAVVVFDASNRLSDQDKRIAGLAVNAGRAILLVGNKWDVLQTQHEGELPPDQLLALWETEVKQALPRIHFAPVIAVSALTGKGIQRLPGLIKEVYENYTRHIATSSLNRVVREALDRHSPPSVKGRQLKIQYVTQVRTGPPAFIFFVNDPELVPANYRQYLENRLRAAYPLHGTPIRLVFRRS